MLTSEKIEEISRALCKFQGEICAVKKEQENPYYKSKYSDLASIWSSIRPSLSKHGLSVIQETTTQDAGVSITTRLLHVSGQFIEVGPLTIFLAKRDPHSVGSATSYGKRYSLCACLGIVSSNEDDDANIAQNAGESKASIVPTVDVNAFKDQWLATYPQLDEYLKARASYKRHSVQKTISECAQDQEIFVKNIETWIKKKVAQDKEES